MRYILFVILFLNVSSVTLAQKRLPIAIYNADLNNDNNVLIYRFDIPNSDLFWSRIFMSNNRLNVSYCRTDSVNTITNYHSYLGYRKWIKKNIEVPMEDTVYYRSRIYPTVYGAETYPVYLFYGDSVLYYSYLETKNSDWIGNRKLAVTLGKNNSIIGVVSGTSGNSYVLFNSQGADGKNYIIKAHSVDNGHNWGLTSMAIKHNMKELKGWCLASHSDKPQIGYLLLTDAANVPYYSKTKDGGLTWSYPKKISAALSGDNYRMIINKGSVIVAFRKLTDNKLADNNDMMIWHGSLQEFTSEQKRGNLMKIIDNEPNADESDFTIEDITYYKNRHYFVLLKRFTNGNSSLQIHLIRRTKK